MVVLPHNFSDTINKQKPLVSHRTWVPLISGISLRYLTVIWDNSIKHGWSHACLDHCVSLSDHRFLIHWVLLLPRNILHMPAFLSLMHYPKPFQNMTYSALEKQHPYERIHKVCSDHFPSSTASPMLEVSLFIIRPTCRGVIHSLAGKASHAFWPGLSISPLANFPRCYPL